MRSMLRSMLLLILGLAVGAVATATIGNVLRMRDAYPRAVMVLMRHHMSMLQAEARNGRCPAADTTLHLRRLDAVSQDIIPAFSGADGRVDPDFSSAARRLRKAFAAGLAKVPATCADLTRTMQDIGDACDDCHRRFR
jgi:hypothetical protein